MIRLLPNVIKLTHFDIINVTEHEASSITPLLSLLSSITPLLQQRIQMNMHHSLKHVIELCILFSCHNCICKVGNSPNMHCCICRYYSHLYRHIWSVLCKLWKPRECSAKLAPLTLLPWPIQIVLWRRNHLVALCAGGPDARLVDCPFHVLEECILGGR